MLVCDWLTGYLVCKPLNRIVNEVVVSVLSPAFTVTEGWILVKITQLLKETISPYIFPKKQTTFWTQVKSATHRTSERTAAHEFDILMMAVWALLEPSPGRPAAHLVFLCCDTAKVYQSFPQGRMPVNYINFSHPSFWYCVSTTEGVCLNFKSVLWIIWAFPPKLSQHMSRIWRIPSSR